MIRRIAVIAVLLCATSGFAAEVRVFAAASLTDALQEIAAAYEKTCRDTIVFNFAGSSTLARQIEQGAPADLFLSADEEKMDRLQRENLIAAATRVAALGNSLVVVVPRAGGEPLASPRDLATRRFGRIAIADPSTVPAGIYAKQWLVTSRMWDAVASKLIPTENVRAALAAVESENVDAAIVYRTDALASRRARVVWNVPPSPTLPIVYPFALVAGTENRHAALRFLNYLRSKPALSVFARHGFVIR